MTKTAHPHKCATAKSGSLFPCSHEHRIGEAKHCRECGCEIRFTKMGRFEHK